MCYQHLCFAHFYLQETMMDHALRTISYIADIGNIVVLMARRRMPRTASQDCIETTPGAQEGKKQYKMICHVFESEDVSTLYWITSKISYVLPMKTIASPHTLYDAIYIALVNDIPWGDTRHNPSWLVGEIVCKHGGMQKSCRKVTMFRIVWNGMFKVNVYCLKPNSCIRFIQSSHCMEF